MNTKNIDALRQRVAQAEAEEQTRFVTALGDQHGLPAVALTAIDALFTHGTAHAVRLGEAVESYETAVSLSEPGEPVATPALLAQVDLSDMVLVNRASLRDALTVIAGAGRTEVQLADTQIAEGAPTDGKKKSVFDQLVNMNDPRKAAQELDRLAKEGKIETRR